MVNGIRYSFGVMLLFFCSRALAQAAPVVVSVSPDVILPGVTTEVVLNGDNLGGTTAVLVAGEPDGLNAKLVAAPSTAPAANKQVKIKITASADARRGQHELRLVTAA